jgi:hypothetical protein
MQRKCAYGLAALALATVSVFGPATARAQTVSAPIVHGNLAVYPIEGGTVSQATPLTIGQAMERGLVKIKQLASGGVRVDNLSSQSIFIPFGTLLAGGLQDQVVSLSTNVPPNAVDAHLYVFCVDPFRMTARQSESGDAFTTSGELIPSRNAELSMVLNIADSDAAWRIRQAGIWWSIDTLRSQLERTLQTTLKPATSVAWTPDFSDDNPAMKVLSLRSSAWTDSLPQALSNPDLRSAQARYELAFRGLPGSSRSHVTGAAFVIDGKLVGVETYRSPELFRQMWPQLLRAYSTEAIAAPKRASTPLPSAGALHKLLAAARAKTDDGWTIEHSTSVHETDDLFYSEVRDADGVMIAASYLPKALAARNVMTPDALVVDMLEHDKLDSLTDNNRIAFARDAAGVWSAAISAPAISAPLAESGGTSIPSQPPAAPRFAAGWPILVASMGVFAVLLLRRRLLSLCKRLAVPVLNGLSTAGSATKRHLVSVHDGFMMTSAGIKQVWRKAIAILNEPLIPSPLAVARMCMGMNRVRRTR